MATEKNDKTESKATTSKKSYHEPIWSYSNQLERFFDVVGVKFESVDDVPVTDIDYEASLHNRARLGDNIIEEHVEELCQRSIILPLDFKRFVAYKTTSGKYVLCDGNHRLAALKRMGFTKCCMYVIKDAGPDQLDELTRVINSFEGRGQSTQERMAHATYTAMKPGNSKSIAQIAEWYNVNYAALRKSVNLQVHKKMLEPSGILPVRNYTNISDHVLSDIVEAFKDHHDVFRAFVAGLAGLTIQPDRNAVRAVIEAIQKLPLQTAANMLAELEKHLEVFRQKDKKATKGGGALAKRKPSGAQLLIRAAEKLCKLFATHIPDGKSALDVFKNDEDRESWFALAGVINDTCKKTRKELNTAVGGD